MAANKKMNTKIDDLLEKYLSAEAAAGVKRLRTTLGVAFPHTHPLSRTMFRLAVLREDLSFQDRSVGAAYENPVGPYPFQSQAYFLRAQVVTLYAPDQPRS